MKRLIALMLCMIFVGCATGPTAVPAPTLFSTRLITKSADVEPAFYATLADCNGVLVGLENRSTTLKWWGVGLQTAGAIAGSILLPIAAVTNASRTMMTLWGTIAGFTNTEISVVRNEGLGAADFLLTRSRVQAAMDGAILKYFSARADTPPSLVKIASAIDELKVACISYWVASPSATQIITQ